MGKTYSSLTTQTSTESQKVNSENSSVKSQVRLHWDGAGLFLANKGNNAVSSSSRELLVENQIWVVVYERKEKYRTWRQYKDKSIDITLIVIFSTRCLYMALLQNAQTQDKYRISKT